MRFASFLSGGLNIISSHSSKSIWVIKLPFCQNDSPMRGSVWQKDSLITYILFELWIIMTFSSPERKLAKHTSVHYLGRNRLLKPFLILPSLMGMKQKKTIFFSKWPTKKTWWHFLTHAKYFDRECKRKIPAAYCNF